jgi:aminoglycoside phosphotransferase (APT) family kinase protein
LNSPPAEVEIDERLVRSLLADQHADLAGLPLVETDSGWDNNLWRLGENLVIRLPRRAVAAPLLVNEQRWLPELAPALPLPIPAPVRLGQPSGNYPWSWSIVPWFEGCPGDRTPTMEPHDTAKRLAQFLRALHRQAPSGAPHNPYRGVPLRDRAAAFVERMAQLSKDVDVLAAKRVWDRALGAEPWRAPAVWVHGDLHPANTVFVDGRLAAVLDFGDLCAGDPAVDMAGAWLLLPASVLPTFLSVYGDVDLDLQWRSLGWAVLFALMLLSIGIDGRPTYARVGRAGLEKVIESSDRIS